MKKIALLGAKPDDFVFERQRVENRLAFFWFFLCQDKKNKYLSNETTQKASSNNRYYANKNHKARNQPPLPLLIQGGKLKSD